MFPLSLAPKEAKPAATTGPDRYLPRWAGLALHLHWAGFMFGHPICQASQVGEREGERVSEVKVLPLG